MRKLLVTAVAVLLTLGASPLQAEDSGATAAELSAPYRSQTDEAMRRGRLMFLHDQAAWHATDKMLEDFGSSPDKRLRGYVILPGDTEKTLAAVFFGEVDGKHVEFARYEIDVNKVVGSKVFAEGERPPLSPLAERLISARDTAIAKLIEEQYGFCSDQQANYVLLPPGDDGIISAYFLTPQTDGSSYPLGGHFRIDIGGDGKVTSSRRFMNTCFMVNLKDPKDTSGKPMDLTAVFVTHLLDPQPTEIHAFASYYLPLDLMIITTQNKLLWDINKGRVVEVANLPDQPADAD